MQAAAGTMAFIDVEGDARTRPYDEAPFPNNGSGSIWRFEADSLLSSTQVHLTRPQHGQHGQHRQHTRTTMQIAPLTHSRCIYTRPYLLAYPYPIAPSPPNIPPNPPIPPIPPGGPPWYATPIPGIGAPIIPMPPIPPGCIIMGFIIGGPNIGGLEPMRGGG